MSDIVVYDKDNNPVSIPEEDASKAWNEGYGFDEGQTVTVENAMGDREEIPVGDSLTEAMRGGGSRIVPTEEKASDAAAASTKQQENEFRLNPIEHLKAFQEGQLGTIPGARGLEAYLLDNQEEQRKRERLIPGQGYIGAAHGYASQLALGGLSLGAELGAAEGASVLGRAGTAAVRMGARGAIEGGVRSAGGTFDEAALSGEHGDYDNLASKMLSAGARGAVVGGLTGFALGGAGSLIGSGVKAGAGAIAGETTVGKVASDVSDAAAMKAAKIETAAAEAAGGKAEVAKVLFDQGVISAENTSLKSINAAAAKKAEEIATKVESDIAAAESAGTKIEAGTAKAFAADVESLPPAIKKTFNQDTLTSLAEEAKAGGLSPTKVHEFRTALADAVAEAGGKKSPKELKALIDKVDEVMDAAVPGYKSANESLKVVKLAESSTAKAIEEGAKESPGILKGLGLGALFTGHLPGFLSASAANYVKKQAWERAPAALAVLAKKLAASDMKIADAISRTVNGTGRVLGGATIIAATTGAILGQRPSETRLDAFKRVQQQITYQRNNPYPYIQSKIGNLASVAPQTAMAAAGRIQRANEFLVSVMPGQGISPNALQPHLQPNPISDLEIAKFSRSLEVVQDPTRVLDHMAAGTLTKEHVTAIRTVDPALYDDIRGKTMVALAESKTPVSYETKISMGMLFDLPTDRSLTPASIARVQLIFSQAQQAQANQSSQMMATLKSKSAERYASQSDKLSQGKLDQ